MIWSKIGKKLRETDEKEEDMRNRWRRRQRGMCKRRERERAVTDGREKERVVLGKG